MPWVSNEQLAEARKVDLLTYLQEREPHELVRSAPGEYRTASHGSLVISKGAWYWNRGQIGGRSALDYLVKVRGYGLAKAVGTVSGVRPVYSFSSLPVKRQAAEREDKPLTLPPRTKYPTQLLSYLQGRGIRPDAIKECLTDGILYEGRFGGEAVCVFVSKDDTGRERFGCMRGINGDIKRDCAGSDKRFSFRLTPNGSSCEALAVLESPIDAMSHLCLYPDTDTHKLSLGGTSDTALVSFLESNPQIKQVSLCLDADNAGQEAARRIKSALAANSRFSRIAVTVDPPTAGKDYNEALLHTVRQERAQKQAGHHKDAGLSI